MPTSPASAIVKTKLDIYPLQTLEDCDELVILPPAKVKELFDIFWELGFKHTALSGYLERHLRQPLQIFSIKPIIEPYLGKVKDLEFFYEITTEYIEIFMTIDKMTKELLGMSGEYDEKNNSKVKFKIMLYEEITTKLLSHYIDEMIKISR
jgi:sporulation-control protein spo0M